MPDQKIPSTWEVWCGTGNHGRELKELAVRNSFVSGHVRGCYSDMVLHPDVDHDHSMYPSVEHIEGPENRQAVAVESRLVNHMKSHLSEPEFWHLIEHLFSVGVQKGKILPPFGKRLPNHWSPQKHFTKSARSPQVKAPLPVAVPHVPKAPPTPAVKKPALDLDAILVRLRKLKPAKRATAVNAIKAMFQFTAPISDVSADRLLNALARRGALTIDANGKISYATPAS